MQPIRIEITPVAVDADEHTQAQRADTVRRLNDLGHITADDGHVNDQVTGGWQATVNGAVVPLAGYAVEPDEDGRALVTLVVAADTVSVGRSPAGSTTPAASAPAAAPRSLSTWGQPGTPDPRKNIPGWSQPDRPAEQAAANDEAVQA